MDDAGELSYKPPSDFEEDKRDPLIELKLTDSTELWLLQWPLNHVPDFDGQEVSLELHHDGILGSIESSSGKPYDVYSRKAQDPELSVFSSSSSSSSSEAKIVGTFSRHVSFIHYPEPSEYEKANQISLKEFSQRSSSFTPTKTGSTFHRLSATKSSRQRTSSLSPSVFTATPAPSSRHKTSSSKEKTGGGSVKNKTMGPSLLLPEDSGRVPSTVTTSGSAGQHSQERKSKKSKKS